MNGNHQGLQHYRTLDLQSRIEEASPHELINMLLQGARSNILSATNHLHHGRIKEKGEHISKAISIMDGLRSSLNHENGGEIAKNLDNLYDYIQQILLKANLDNNESLFVEAHTLLNEIHVAWQEIKPNASVTVSE